ncbi:ATP-dependent protease La Type II [gamma proteobacterium IMCC2047]|nr:ATP-dependent protease La Type II [gamma proteobacterium IMCC2047]
MTRKIGHICCRHFLKERVLKQPESITKAWLISNNSCSRRLSYKSTATGVLIPVSNILLDFG